MNMPKITAAQIVAIAAVAISVAVAFGLPIDTEQRYALLAFVGAVAGVFLHSDVQIRKNRAQNAEKIAAAQQAAKPSVIAAGSNVAAPPLHKPATTKPKGAKEPKA